MAPLTKKGAKKAAPAKVPKAAPKKAALKKASPAPKASAEPIEAKETNAESEAKETLVPKPVVSRKRSRSQEPEALPAAKKLKLGPTINTPPVERLDVYVFGGGENNELGLGAQKIDGKSPSNVKRPRYNPFLKADGGPLGRDTSSYEAPAKDIDADSDSEDEDEITLNPVESTPTAINTEFLEGRKVVQVLASDSASFVLTADGYVYGWGSFVGNDGIIGFTAEGAAKAAKEKDGDAKKKLQIQTEPILISGLKNIKTLARGSNHILALDKKGTVFTWGAHEQNQLGRRVSDRFRFAALAPTQVLKNCKSIAAGAYHSFAINNKDQVVSWGLNNYGQTGIATNAGGDDAIISNPTVVKSFEGFNVAQIKGCLHHTIACTKDQQVIDQDNLIISSTTSKPAILKTPTMVPGITATFVSGAIDNSIAIAEDGKVWAWGYSENYRTGLGTDDTIWTPTAVENTAIKGKKMSFAGCGGQFSVLAGPEVELTNGA
ncbi:hypothetical protein DID88_000095 [Monilinia fructigena]|uniref:RCC1-like domain-containing protein n=1 Tax=Monilinia fructigena TaxID=38457 RepID=A0A395IPN9_9HELO|nr:hypothetical protein DID88_000095 [Monilinia fructigena]